MLYSSRDDRDAADLDLARVHPVVAGHLEARNWLAEEGVVNRVSCDVVEIVVARKLVAPCACGVAVRRCTSGWAPAVRDLDVVVVD